jgi:DNA repair exonuclease SbcCD ATPase subunit
MSRASRHLTTRQREAAWQRQVAALRQDNDRLIQMLAQLQSQTQTQLADLQSQLHTQAQQIGQLQDQLNPVKPPRSKKERTPRHERAPQHNHARRREPVSPDQVVRQQRSECPDCGMALHHYKLSHRHQVIDIPPPAELIVIEHLVKYGVCWR